MAEPLQISDVTVFAHNRHWRFAVARMGERWVGLARAHSGEPYLHVMPEVSEGYTLGLPLDQHERALALASAVVADDEATWGDVEAWHIPPEQRGNPDDYRCAHCEAIGCNGLDCMDYHDEG